MRGKKTLINTLAGLIEELVAVICGFVLPRLILSAFGSDYNGLITSITQFLSCAILLRSGIGGATRAALYKPLADNNKHEINSILKATDNFMKKVGAILGILIIVFSTLYPLLVKNEFGWFFTFSLFIIIGLSTFAESFFGITYLILLQADQKLWVSSLLKSICYIINTVLASVLIYCDFSIHIVKLGSAVIFVLYPIVQSAYVKKHYKINTNVEPNNSAISQRWDAFWHQVAIFVMNNTDVMVLTVFSNMKVVSVYSVYNMIVNGLKRAVFSFSNGLEAAFGNMIAKKEKLTLKLNFSIIELVFYNVATIVYTTAGLLIVPFVRIYTAGVNDIDYAKPVFAIIILVAQFFNCVRLPYQLVVQAAGHYKQTKKGAIVEPIINISLSVALVIKYGLVGVAIGTLVATIFRTIQFSIYMAKNIVKRNQFISLFKCFVAALESGLIILIFNFISLNTPTNYYQWIVSAIVVFLISTIVVIVISIVFYHKTSCALFLKIKNIIKK